MAGLLDIFDDPSAQIGLGLLAAASPRADGAGFGQRLMEGVQSATAMKRSAQQQKMLELQMAAAQRKADLTNQFLGELSGAPSGVSPASGAVAGAGGSAVAPQGGQFANVPRSAIAADLAFNDGKHLGEWSYNNSRPTWVQAGNKFINTNAPDFKGGGFDKLNVTPDGKAVIEGADGSVRVAPGSLEAYTAFKNADAGVANANDLVDVPDGNGGTIKMTKADALSKLSGTVAPKSAIPSVGSVQPSAQDMAIIEADAKANGIQSPFVNFKGQPSQLGRTLSKAEEVRRVKTAEADVTRDTNNQADAKRFGQMQEGITRALNLLGQGPTASGIGTAVDTALGAFGKSTSGADVASQLRTLSGWLTANVPRMEGPQSDRDVMNYQVQAGMVGDSTKPVSQRIKAAKEVMSLQQKYAELNGYADKAPKTNDAGQPEVKSWKDYGYKNPAAAIQDAQNAIIKNPAAKAEVVRRLKAMGLELPSGASGGF